MPSGRYKIAIRVGEGEFQTRAFVAENNVEADAEAVRFIIEELNPRDYSESSNVRLLDDAGKDLWRSSMTIADLRKRGVG